MDGAKFLMRYAEQGTHAVFVFVDHTRAHEPVLEAARLLDSVVSTEGFALFHDYNDWRNLDPNDPAFL